MAIQMKLYRKNLYPEDHPYNWTVIGSLANLQAATLEDVKEFYNKYYGAANASLVIAGDIDIPETKKLVKKWFGEIPSGPKVEPLNPMPVSLDETKSLYFKDNFAKLPELRMVYPTVEAYNKDEYTLNVLGQLLSGSRKSPLYKIIVEEEKLAPNVSSYNNSSELAGEFVIRVRANEGVDLDEVKKAIDKGLQDFETNGFTDTELQRIKAELETQLYYGVATVLNKAFQLVQDNEFGNDPGYISKRTKLYKEITRADVMRVYNTYIKDKNFVMTSIIPKDSTDLAVENATEASVWEEEVTEMDESEEVGQGEEAVYEKTPSKYDRSEPAFGKAPLFDMPEVWQAKLDNGMKVLGIENNELPLVTFELTFPGGHRLDPENKAGLAVLTADLMNEGTKTKTPAELEEAIGLLGSSISIRGGLEEINVSGSCLARNFEETVKLVREMVLEPRWDEKEFERLKQELRTSLKGQEANPQAIAGLNFNKLIYGENHKYAIPTDGTLETEKNISLNDVKDFYKNLSPNGASFKVVGNIKKQRVTDALAGLSNNWKGEQISIPSEEITSYDSEGTLYFIDVPNSKQSVIYIGLPALSANNNDYTKLDFANEILGGGSSGRLFQTLRIEKGYTYGAYSYIPTRDETAPFTIRTSVRANATLPSLEIIENMVKEYGPGFTKEDVALTQNKVIKQNTRAYESLNAKLNMLTQIDKYGKSTDYINKEQQLLMKMNLEDFKNIINKYIKENKMVYVVVGDKATQFEEVKKLGKNVIELDIHGNPVK